MNPNEASANLTRNITNNTTTKISGKFVLLAIVINTKGASSNIAKIYDSVNSDERLQGTLDTTVEIGRIEYNVPMLNGIRIVTEVGTPADLTLIYAETP